MYKFEITPNFTLSKSLYQITHCIFKNLIININTKEVSRSQYTTFLVSDFVAMFHYVCTLRSSIIFQWKRARVRLPYKILHASLNTMFKVTFRFYYELEIASL